VGDYEGRGYLKQVSTQKETNGNSGKSRTIVENWLGLFGQYDLARQKGNMGGNSGCF